MAALERKAAKPANRPDPRGGWNPYSRVAVPVRERERPRMAAEVVANSWKIAVRLKLSKLRSEPSGPGRFNINRFSGVLSSAELVDYLFRLRTDFENLANRLLNKGKNLADRH